VVYPAAWHDASRDYAGPACRSPIRSAGLAECAFGWSASASPSVQNVVPQAGLPFGRSVLSRWIKLADRALFTTAAEAS